MLLSVGIKQSITDEKDIFSFKSYYVQSINEEKLQRIVLLQ